MLYNHNLITSLVVNKNLNTNKKNIFIRTLAILQLVVASGVCIYFSSIENISLPEVSFEYIDKLLHFGAFVIYGLSLQVALVANLHKTRTKKIKFIVLLLAAIFAASDEIHQFFVPGRSSDILDWLADMLGVCLSLLTYNLICKIFKNIYKLF